MKYAGQLDYLCLLFGSGIHRASDPQLWAMQRQVSIFSEEYCVVLEQVVIEGMFSLGRIFAFKQVFLLLTVLDLHNHSF